MTTRRITAMTAATSRRYHNRGCFTIFSAAERATSSAIPSTATKTLSIFPSVVASTHGSRFFATGTRGARGHGWYVNYRAGKGGRHLQGEYADDTRGDPEQLVAWNQAMLGLGSTRVYLDIVLMNKGSEPDMLIRKKNSSPVSLLENKDISSLPRHRLTFDLASTVMSATCDNFIQLMQNNKTNGEGNSYLGTRLYRLERNVGICGGDVLTNTGKTGQAAPVVPNKNSKKAYSSLTRTIEGTDPLALWHVPGTITMLVPTVGEIDSRFMLCHGGGGSGDDDSDMLAFRNLHHLDGIHCAFGHMTPESLALVKHWASTILTRTGVPSIIDLVIADCGVLSTTTMTVDNSGQDDERDRKSVV